MNWTELRALWKERDRRYDEARAKPSRESIEAARLYRATEAAMIEAPDDRREALDVVEAVVKPQTAAVLALLREQGVDGVTPALALSEVGTMRLAARIAELRAEGHEIVNVGWTTPRGAHVALYVLREPLTLWRAS